jgi:class 3 adenylate cyclase
LASLDESQLEETLQDLGIGNRLHRRVILQKLRDISTKFEKPESGQEDGSTRANCSGAGNEEEDDLQLFDELVTQALNKSSPTVVYAGVHLVPNTDENGKGSGVGHVVLAGSLRRTSDGKTLRMPRFSAQPVEESTCYRFVRDRTDMFYETVLPNVDTWASGKCYSGYALVNEEAGDRVGCICLLDSAESCDERSAEKEALMRELAVVAESQIKRQNAILAREASLRNQMKHLLYESVPTDFMSGGDAKHLKAASDQSDTPRNRSLLGNDLSDDTICVEAKGPEIASENSSSPLSNRKDTASEARFREVYRAGEDEASHLSPNFFNVIDSVGAPRPPIAKDDMRSIAAAQELDFRSIVVHSNIGQKIKKFVRMACKLVDFPMGSLAFHEHLLQYHVGSYAENPEHEKIFQTAFEVLQRSNDGTTFACQKDRGSAICNYPLFLKETFVIRDMAEDGTFAWLTDAVGLRAYIGSPLVDDAGRVIANLCLYDFRPHTELDRRSEVQVEQICLLILQELHVWSMAQKVEKLEQERLKLLSRQVPVLKTKPPQGEATIVLTDIEGSTALWEANPHAMQSALETHDQIIQKCTREHNGYVVTTEGDAWYLAFHDPVDAIAFALKAQCQLFYANWESDILELENAREVPGSFRGLRVRMGIHHDRVDTSQNEVSRRVEYSGAAWNIGRSIEAMSHGGQIVTSVETWNLASSLGDQQIGAFQVLDLGTHVLHVGRGWNEGVVSKGIVQLVPEVLSFAYFKARRLQVPTEDDDDEPVPLTTTSATLQGRQFPPPVTKCQVGPSFHDAPFAKNVATIMFLCAEEIERASDDFPAVRSLLARSISDLLVKHGRGYHCQSFMLSFAIEDDAIKFGLKYIEVMKEHEAKKRLETDDGAHVSYPLSSLVKFGCVTGHFLSMGPHHHSGRADYFGKVVNRAARVAHSAAAGSVYLGVPSSGAVRKPAAQGLEFVYVGIKPLKGVREEFSLYECKKRKKPAA